MKIREKKCLNPPVSLFLPEKMQGSWVQSQMGTKLLKDSNGFNNVVESFNSSWTDSLTRRASLYELLGGFKRKEAVSELELRKECLAVGVSSVSDTSSRNRRRSEQRTDLKKLCQSFEVMSARSYMDSTIPFLSQG